MMTGGPVRRLRAPASPGAPLVVTPREQRLILLKRKVIGSLRAPIRHARALPWQRHGMTNTGHTPGGSALTALEIEEFSYYRGVLSVAGSLASAAPVNAVGLVTDGAAFRLGVELPGVLASPFGFDVGVGDHAAAARAELAVRYASGRVDRIADIAARALAGDPVAELTQRFRDAVAQLDRPRVLEIGSRARSGNTYRDWLPHDATYVGCDIVPGVNVDVVGDAHRLSGVLPAASFDALFSVSTMEHLAMPWQAAAEMNRVLRPGGLMFHATHQTWPVHDAPWDFYRFSEYAWVTLFNRFSGFEIVATASGEPGKVVANVVHPATNGLELQPAFLSSAVLARKVASTELEWAADAAAVVQDAYPY